MDGHDQPTALRRASNFARACAARAAQWRRWQNEAEAIWKDHPNLSRHSPVWSKSDYNFPNTPTASRVASANSEADPTGQSFPDIHRPVGRRELLRRGPGLQSFPGRLELRLGGVEILGRPMGSPPGRWTVTLQIQTHGIRSVAKRIRPMRCLPSSTAKSLRPMERSFSISNPAAA